MPSSPKPFDESFDWCVRRIYRVNQVTENNDINYGLEYVGEYDPRHAYDNEFVYTLPGIMALGDAAGNGVGFIYDTYHTYCDGRGNDDFHLALHNIDRISGVHFSDGMPCKSL
jgi:sugar phosphate isomerase/epimerase